MTHGSALHSQLFSVRMRAAAKANCGNGELHLTGCERLIEENKIPAVMQDLIQRIWTHTRGKADIVNIRIDKVDGETLIKIPPLNIESVEFSTIGEAHEHAIVVLREAGVSERAARRGVSAIGSLQTSMRGGMILDANSGDRMDSFGERGVRLSHMDCEDEGKFLDFLKKNGANGAKIREAVILASKAATAEGYIAELCWSDDPNYVTGYVASKKKYERLSPMKLSGSMIGGRVFFFRPRINLETVINFFESQPVLVEVNHGR